MKLVRSTIKSRAFFLGGRGFSWENFLEKSFPKPFQKLSQIYFITVWKSMCAYGMILPIALRDHHPKRSIRFICDDMIYIP